MNDQAKHSALTTFTNVGHSSMCVLTVLYAIAVLYLAQVFDPPSGELLADIAEMAISFGRKSTEHPPLMAIVVNGGPNRTSGTDVDVSRWFIWTIVGFRRFGTGYATGARRAGRGLVAEVAWGG